MHRLILIFLLVIVAGVATASAADGPGSVSSGPPALASDVTCTALPDGGISCFYPAHDR